MRKSSNDEDGLKLGGVSDDQAAGDPVEDDHLRLALTDEMVTASYLIAESRCS